VWAERVARATGVAAVNRRVPAVASRAASCMVVDECRRSILDGQGKEVVLVRIQRALRHARTMARSCK
jgi:hypothetical protein